MAHDYSAVVEKVAGENILAKISEVAREIQEQLELIDKTEKALKLLKEHQRYLEEEKLPDLMEEAEQTELTTTDGLKIKITEKVRAGFRKDLKNEACKWLIDNGHGRIVREKFIVEFGPNDQDWAKELEDYLAHRDKEMPFERKRDAHWQTLSTLMKELAGDGVELPTDLFHIHNQKKAVVKAS